MDTQETGSVVLDPEQAVAVREKIGNLVWKESFLSALSVTGNVCKAADAAGINRRVAYLLRSRDPEFQKEWELALQAAGALMEAEAKRRATEGLVKYKFGKNGEPLLHPKTGEPYYELEYSDTLLIFLLKRIFPTEYRENWKHIIGGDKDNPLQTNHTHELGDHLKAHLEALAAESGRPGSNLPVIEVQPVHSE